MESKLFRPTLHRRMQADSFGRVAELVPFPFSKDMRCLLFHPVPQLPSFPTFRVSQRSIVGEVDDRGDITYICCALHVALPVTSNRNVGVDVEVVLQSQSRSEERVVIVTTCWLLFCHPDDPCSPS